MNILIVNDDGISSRGIIMLAKAAKAFGNVTVVAPDGQRSGMSQHITVHGDIIVNSVPDFPVSDVRAYQISGTPADCVRVGVWYAMEERPDLVLSGINAGFNAGVDVVYSGTVGAAKEAVIMGIPAIAFSVGTFEYLDDVEEYLVPMICDLSSHPAGNDAFWNINFPKFHKEEIRGVLEDRFPVPEPYFQTGYYPAAEEAEDGVHLGIRMTYPEQVAAGSDIQALLDGYISVGQVGHIRPDVP